MIYLHIIYYKSNNVYIGIGIGDFVADISVIRIWVNTHIGAPLSPVMRNPDFSRPFILQTDASEVRVGAILSQTDTEGYDPVAYFSRKLLSREQKYSTIEKE